MKIAFVDESGKGGDDISITCAAIVDQTAFYKTRREWAGLLSSMSTLAGRTITEFHMRDLYGRKRDWAGVGPLVREQAMTSTFDRLDGRAMKFTWSGTQLSSWTHHSDAAKIGCLSSRITCQALHVALSVQKQYQGQANNKGKCLLILDRGLTEASDIEDILLAPPAWTDTYYSRGKNEGALDSIIDTALFADSKHSALIQLADMVAFILRRRAEIMDLENLERFEGELTGLDGWVSRLSKHFLPSSTRYLKKPKCECTMFLCELAPHSIKNI